MSINKYNSTLLKFKVKPNADTYLMVCLLVGLWNENETYIYFAKFNLGMRIKCVGPTQFGNKE